MENYFNKTISQVKYSGTVREDRSYKDIPGLVIEQ